MSEPPRSRARAIVALIRIPQWSKNAFVLAPLFFSKNADDFDAVVKAVIAFACFSLVASAIYVLNDWCDRADDAKHPAKRNRPLASGELNGRDAVVVGTVCMLAAITLAAGAGFQLSFWGVLAAYVVLNVGYSTLFRHVELVDVCVIAAGFVLRVLAGTTAIEVTASSWIILSTGLLALLLALGKRRTDLAQETSDDRRSLNGYTVEFIDTALATLAAAVIGFYALFTVSDYSVKNFESPHLYVTTFWVAVGILRYLQVVINGDKTGSPTEIALEDRPLQFLVAGWLITFLLLSYHF